MDSIIERELSPLTIEHSALPDYGWPVGAAKLSEAAGGVNRQDY
jgi:hypothetical protein